jgi:hypothetical protein
MSEATDGVEGLLIVALLVVAAPAIGWALLFGLAGAIENPGAVMLIVAGLAVWAGIISMRESALAKQAAAAKEVRIAKLKEPHGGKDRYFVRDGYTIKLMSFDLGAPYQQAGYWWAGSYTLPDRFHSSSEVPRGMRWLDSPTNMWSDPKRLAHWQAVFEEWIETGVRPSQETWWLFPDEAAEHAEREAERQQWRKAAALPENALTHG